MVIAPAALPWTELLGVGSLEIRDVNQPNYARLQKRARASSVFDLSKCTFKNNQFVTVIAYTGSYEYLRSALVGDLLATGSMSRWYSRTDIDCVPVTILISDPQIDGQMGHPDQRGTIEHVYELNWLKGFWEHVLQDQNWPCDEFNHMMFNPCNRLQSVYDGLPGNEHWNFAGVTQEINRLKTMAGPAIGFILRCAQNIDPCLAATYRHWVSKIRVGTMLSAARQAFDDLLPTFENSLNAEIPGAMNTDNGLQELDAYRQTFQILKDRYRVDSPGSVCNRVPDLSWQLISLAVFLDKGDACPIPTSTTDPSTTATAPTKTTTDLPIPTSTSRNGPACYFAQHNAGSYVSFNVTGAKAAMEAISIQAMS
ncbi:hypothetical protein BBP40_011767 [Aspergillus hancockii]|nr:hypothetical protein BBP40_011767 [Aspergillus hancockii]